MKVLFNADDFGLTKGITDGIVDAHIQGVVNSATLMMNGHALDYAVNQAKQQPDLKVGIHLVLSWGKPLLRDVEDLVNEEGNFKYTSILSEPPNTAEVKREWRAQIEAFLKTGLRLHHLDSHHHVHGWEPLRDVIIELAEEYHVPVRYVDTLQNRPDLCLTETLWTGFYADGVKVNVFDELKELDVASVEVMTHPAYPDMELSQVSSYVDMRKKELDILTDLPVPEWAELM